MFCQTCGQQLSDDAVFCHKCGRSQPSTVQENAASASAAPVEERTKKCPFCAETIAENAIKCRFCNSMLYQQAPVVVQQTVVAKAEKRIAASNPPKDPVLMALLSGCCIAGLGQIVLGQALKGVIVLIASIVLGAVSGGVSVLVTWPLGAIDAYLIAKKLKEGQTVGEWDFF